jgi:hypothetical protein
MLNSSKSSPRSGFLARLFRLGARLAILGMVLQISVPTALGLISNSADAASFDLTSSSSFCAYPGAKVALDPADDQQDTPDVPENHMVLCIFCFVCQTGSTDSSAVAATLERAKDLKENTKASNWYFVTLPQSKFASFRHASRAPPSFI